MYAINDGQRVAATPGLRALCPCCTSTVIAKCGEFKEWHWAHESLSDCDPWTEAETDWHIEWKSRFPESNREVVIGPHRADVRTDTGWVVEFQHSEISVAEIREREAFYGRMCWVLDSWRFFYNLSIGVSGNHYGVHWAWAHKSWTQAEKPIFIDLRNGWLMRVVGKPNDGNLICRGAKAETFTDWATGREDPIPPVGSNIVVDYRCKHLTVELSVADHQAVCKDCRQVFMACSCLYKTRITSGDGKPAYLCSNCHGRGWWLPIRGY